MPALTFRAAVPGAIPARRWSHALAWVLWGATVVLLAAGALVTSTGSSLAVPDWPLAYGRFFPPMVGGILYEHGHRMIAATVGLLSVALALQLWLVEPRRWVRALGFGAVGLVVFQGLLGGITVLFLLPRPVSIGHALFAQLFFAGTVLLVQATAPGWERLTGAACGADAAAARHPRGWGLATIGALLVQLLIGATVRHNGAGLAIPDFPLAYGLLIPPLESFEVTIHFAHRVGALGVLALVAVTAWRALTPIGSRPALPPLRVPALAMLGLVAGQILLGGAVIWSQRAIAATTVHLVVGALLLAATVWLAFRAHALATPGRHIGGFPPWRLEREAMMARAGEAPLSDAGATLAAKAGVLVHDLLLLAKPRITGMVLVATAFGYLLAPGPPGGSALDGMAARDWAVAAWMLLGTLLVAVGGNALNQYIERNSDRLMPRTRERPLPSGRMTARAVLIGGIACASLGIALLYLAAHPLAALVAGIVVVTYVLCYTPLKARTGLNTLVGAVPGALPPVLGWAAAEGSLGQGAWALFLIMFVWQLPHFLAIAWIYRDDYASAHLPMLTVEDPDGARTRRQVVLYSAVLVPVSLYPAMIGMAGHLYFYGAFALSLGFAGTALAMAARPDLRSAKLVLRASLVYLPLLFLLMWFDAR